MHEWVGVPVHEVPHAVLASEHQRRAQRPVLRPVRARGAVLSFDHDQHREAPRRVGFDDLEGALARLEELLQLGETRLGDRE